jgi:iron complex outermembrane receptor protein
MKSSQKVSRTVAAILAASGVHAACAAVAPAPTIAMPVAGSAQLQEVVVTAQRRSQNIQNVPITMEAITGKTLQGTSKNWLCCLQ